MDKTLTAQSLVVAPGQTLSLAKLVAIPASASNPAYLVLNGYDRNEYTVASSGATGSFSGNAHTLGFSSIGDDARGAGIVFSYSVSTGRYSNSTYGFLDQLTYTVSASVGDITDLSLFGTNNSNTANNYASNAISLAQVDAAGYLGTLTVAAIPNYRGAVPSQATPLSIAAVAQTFVGSAWNTNGCWTLTSTISAEAGASLPVQSAVNMRGAGNGEWFVAYNGPAGSTGDWASTVRTGDIVALITAGGTGHITTCVSGAGSTAMLIDNTTYVNAQGKITNSANDGSANDIVISAAHSAAQTFAGVAANSVVIYRLDTPTVYALSPTLKIAGGAAVNLSNVCFATEPAGNPITSYQAYSTSATDHFTVNGTTISAASASSAVSASSLSQITFDRGTVATPDTINVRAFNGTYWGDWTAMTTDDTMGSSNSAMSAVSGEIAIYRFFNTQDGTHFFTASASEAAVLQATRPDMSSEGVGMHGYANANGSSQSEAVYRFFNTTDGTHFFTASSSERDSLLASQSSTMSYEGPAFYEDANPVAGDTAVYRFFDTAHGTHLFTQSATERASIIASRPDLVSEGIAFYAPN